MPQPQKWGSRTIAGELHVKRAPLTERNLKIHTLPNMPRPRKDPPTTLFTNTTTSTTTDKRFGGLLRKKGIIYGRVHAEEPEDATAVREFLNRARESNSPDEKDYKEYIETVEYGDNERTMESGVWPLLAKRPVRTRPPGYAGNYDLQWTEIESPLASGLGDAKPDISESYRGDQYPEKASEALGSTLRPTQYSGAMPTICVEWKGPSGLMPSAEKQCAYDGALMVDSAYAAHKYMNKDPAEFLNKTQALTAALNGETARLYGNHVVERGSALKYHQYELDARWPGKSLKEFKETRNQVRNAQDWAWERATRTKDDLHAYAHAKEVVPAMLPELTDEPEVTRTKWLWSPEHGRHYCILPDGSLQWSALVPPASAVTPSSTITSCAIGAGEVKRPRGRPRKKGNDLSNAGVVKGRRGRPRKKGKPP